MVISIMLYALYFCGICILLSEVFRSLRQAIVLSRRLRTSLDTAKEEHPVFVYLGDLASGVFNRDVSGEVTAYGLTVVFLVSFAVACRSFYIPQALMTSVMITAIPIVVMYILLAENQSKSSKEGLSFVSELNRQYRIHGKNMYAAIENTISADGDFPICRKHLYRLLLHLRNSSEKEEIKRHTDGFAFALGTVWGNMLAVCIRMGAVKGSDVSKGLEDISAQLSTAYQRAEERKRMNSESARMTVFLVPILYIGTIIISVKYLSVGFADFFHNQFFTPEGLLFFVISIFLFVVNLAVMRLISNIKLDY